MYKVLAFTATQGSKSSKSVTRTFRGGLIVTVPVLAMVSNLSPRLTAIAPTGLGDGLCFNLIQLEKHKFSVMVLLAKRSWEQPVPLGFHGPYRPPCATPACSKQAWRTQTLMLQAKNAANRLVFLGGRSTPQLCVPVLSVSRLPCSFLDVSLWLWTADSCAQHHNFLKVSQNNTHNRVSTRLCPRKPETFKLWVFFTCQGSP